MSALKSNQKKGKEIANKSTLKGATEQNNFNFHLSFKFLVAFLYT